MISRDFVAPPLISSLHPQSSFLLGYVAYMVGASWFAVASMIITEIGDRPSCLSSLKNLITQLTPFRCFSVSTLIDIQNGKVWKIQILKYEVVDIMKFLSPNVLGYPEIRHKKQITEKLRTSQTSETIVYYKGYSRRSVPLLCNWSEAKEDKIGAICKSKCRSSEL
ncbi:hypothetical protein DINM_005115 [Dirofilaria immitis]|nr:hypothetical protein [Dirofilaria immitis]